MRNSIHYIALGISDRQFNFQNQIINCNNLIPNSTKRARATSDTLLGNTECDFQKKTNYQLLFKKINFNFKLNQSVIIERPIFDRKATIM